MTNQRISTPPARKLTYGVFGVTAAIPLRMVLDMLELKIFAARALGYLDAANAFIAAHYYVRLACGHPESAVALNTQLRDPDFDGELEAALHSVRDAYALIPRSETGPLVPATARRPDPDLVCDRSSLARELRVLQGWTGTSVYAMAARVRRTEYQVGDTDLRATLVFGDLPTSPALNAILIGCGVPKDERASWHAARERALHPARRPLPPPPAELFTPPEPPALPPAAGDPGLWRGPGQLETGRNH